MVKSQINTKSCSGNKTLDNDDTSSLKTGVIHLNTTTPPLSDTGTYLYINGNGELAIRQDGVIKLVSTVP